MAGALAERDFVKKLERAGFTDIEILDRQAFGVDDAQLYPLFTDELIDVMKRTIPAPRQHELATSVVVKAKLLAGRPRLDRIA